MSGYLKYRVFRKLIDLVLKLFEKVGGVFIVFRIYPKRPILDAVSNEPETNEKVAILIQGPSSAQFHFLPYTIRFYRQVYPNAPIVISTWQGEVNALRKEFEQVRDVYILENERPSNSGALNVNYQILSTRAGLEFIKKKNLARYVVKTRTDQRIHSPSFIQFCYSLLQAFPIAKSTTQLKRIIGVSSNTSKYKVYSFSDMFQFGHLDDLLKYWSAPLDDRSFTKDRCVKMIYERCTLASFIKELFPEAYLFKNYLAILGKRNDFSLASYYEALADNFIVINGSALEIFWNKNNRFEVSQFDQSMKKWESVMTFEDWWLIYKSNGITQESQEDFLNTRIY